MTETGATPILDANLWTARVLWGALTATLLLPAGYLVFGPVGRAPQLDPIMALRFLAPAAFAGVFSFVLPLRVERTNLRARAIAVRDTSRPVASASYREATTAQARIFADPPSAATAAAAAYQTSLILGMAMSEAVGLFGVALYVSGARLPLAAALLGASFVLMALRFPTRARQVRAVERIYRATLEDTAE